MHREANGWRGAQVVYVVRRPVGGIFVRLRHPATKELAARRDGDDAVAATTRRAVAPDPKKLKEAARRKTQRDVHRSAGALRAADTAGAEALKELEKRLAALERAKARQAAHGADAIFAAKRDREIADVRNRIGALTARHAHLRNACATRRDRDRKEKHVF